MEPWLGVAWDPHSSVPGPGSMRQVPPPGVGTPMSPRQGDRGVLSLEVLAHQGTCAAPNAFWYLELGRALVGV